MDKLRKVRFNDHKDKIVVIHCDFFDSALMEEVPDPGMGGLIKIIFLGDAARTVHVIDKDDFNPETMEKVP